MELIGYCYFEVLRMEANTFSSLIWNLFGKETTLLEKIWNHADHAWATKTIPQILHRTVVIHKAHAIHPDGEIHEICKEHGCVRKTVLRKIFE